MSRLVCYVTLWGLLITPTQIGAVVIVQAEGDDATNAADSVTVHGDADEETDTEFEIEVSYGEEETSGARSYDCSNGESRPRDLRLFATNKTSTMEREMNEAADAGYRLQDVMGGETAFGGSEVAAVMCKLKDTEDLGRYQYKLLATSKTSTMQKELQEAGDAGYEYRGQTVFDTAFGNQEVIVILERDRDTTSDHSYEYKLLATKKTSTMQRELQEAGDAGYEFVGLTVSSTFFGGTEVVAILRRRPPDDNQ